MSLSINTVIDPNYKYSLHRFKDLAKTFGVNEFVNNGYKFVLESYYNEAFGPVYFVNRNVSMTVSLKNEEDYLQFVYVPGSVNHATKSIWTYNGYLLGKGIVVNSLYSSNMSKRSSKFDVVVDFGLSRALLPVFDVSISVGSEQLLADILNQLLSKLQDRIRAGTFIQNIYFNWEIFGDVKVPPFKKSFRGDILSIVLNVVNIALSKYRPIDLPVLSFIANNLEKQPTLYILPLTETVLSDNSIPVLLNIFVDTQYAADANVPLLEREDEILAHIEACINSQTKQIVGLVFDTETTDVQTQGYTREDVISTQGSTVAGTDKTTDASDNTYNQKIDEFVAKSNSSLFRNSKILSLPDNKLMIVGLDAQETVFGFDTIPFVFRYTETVITKDSQRQVKYLKLNSLCVPYQITLTASHNSELKTDNRKYSTVIYNCDASSYALIVNLSDRTWILYESLQQPDQKNQTVQKAEEITRQLQEKVGQVVDLSYATEDNLFRNLSHILYDRLRTDKQPVSNEKFVSVVVPDVDSQIKQLTELVDSLFEQLSQISKLGTATVDQLEHLLDQLENSITNVNAIRNYITPGQKFSLDKLTDEIKLLLLNLEQQVKQSLLSSVSKLKLISRIQKIWHI